MKTITFYAATNRSDNILHIETDGCIVNIHVGLHDKDGRTVTRVDVLPDNASRGGDGQGEIWEADGSSAIRVIKQERKQK